MQSYVDIQRGDSTVRLGARFII